MMDDASRYKAKLCVGEKVFPDPYSVDEAYWTSDSLAKTMLPKKYCVMLLNKLEMMYSSDVISNVDLWYEGRLTSLVHVML